ncbi:MAG: RidA family protein [Pseudomonadota bacterium]
MTQKITVQTDKAPSAIGPYSQAVRMGNTVYLSGQIPLTPDTMELVEGTITDRTRRVFDNLSAVADAAGGSLSDVVKVNISLTNLNDFSDVNDVMREYFEAPYPARACVQVAALPKGCDVEIEAIMMLA